MSSHMNQSRLYDKKTLDNLSQQHWMQQCSRSDKL